MSKIVREPATASLNKKYGSLTVIEITDRTNSHGEKIVRCLCDCGNEKIAVLSLIKRGSITSCGCMKIKSSTENIKKAHKQFNDMGIWKDPKLRSAQSIYKKYSDEDISFDEFLSLSRMDCFYCGAPPSNRATVYGKNNGITQARLDDSYFIYNGLDRVDSSLGHSKDNVVTCCANCNYAKLDRDQTEFFLWVERVYLNHQKKHAAP